MQTNRANSGIIAAEMMSCSLPRMKHLLQQPYNLEEVILPLLPPPTGLSVRGAECCMGRSITFRASTSCCQCCQSWASGTCNLLFLLSLRYFSTHQPQPLNLSFGNMIVTALRVGLNSLWGHMWLLGLSLPNDALEFPQRMFQHLESHLLSRGTFGTVWDKIVEFFLL